MDLKNSEENREREREREKRKNYNCVFKSFGVSFHSQFNNIMIKVIFSDESGQNLNLVIPTQYDGRSHVKSG